MEKDITLVNKAGSIKLRRGFAAMSPEKQREIAKKGGVAAHMQGVAHKWNSAEASAAGKKGGLQKKRKDDSNQEQFSA